MYFLEFGHPWMILRLVNPKTGETRTEFTSSSSWKTGEIHDFMNWLQMVAAEDGCILETKGEYAHLKQSAVS